jgi:hypothetical protein
MGVSPHTSDNSDSVDVEIEEELAVKFLTGAENLTAWTTVFEDGIYRILKKAESNRFVNSRVSVLAMTQLEFTTIDRADVAVILDTINDQVIISYNGLSVRQFMHPINLYFTREDDPSHLKLTFSLSEKTLSHLAYEMSLNEWPKEIKLAIEDADDVSVYSIKSQLKISLSKI